METLNAVNQIMYRINSEYAGKFDQNIIQKFFDNFSHANTSSR